MFENRKSTLRRTNAVANKRMPGKQPNAPCTQFHAKHMAPSLKTERHSISTYSPSSTETSRSNRNSLEAEDWSVLMAREFRVQDNRQFFGRTLRAWE